MSGMRRHTCSNLATVVARDRCTCGKCSGTCKCGASMFGEGRGMQGLNLKVQAVMSCRPHNNRVLSSLLPFRVHFKNDHSLVGRVIRYAGVRGSPRRFEPIIEYPIGSGVNYLGASQTSRQMYKDFRERLGIGGGRPREFSDGYKELEYNIFETDDWHALGELLTEDVRYYRVPVSKKLLPTPCEGPIFLTTQPRLYHRKFIKQILQEPAGNPVYLSPQLNFYQLS